MDGGTNISAYCIIFSLKSVYDGPRPKSKSMQHTQKITRKIRTTQAAAM